MKVAIVGAGYIGLYVGARLIEAGLEVVFIGRERMKTHIQENGLKVNSYLNQSFQVPREKIHYLTDYSQIGKVDAYLIAVKTTQTDEMLKELLPYIDLKAPIINLQNGVENKLAFESFDLKSQLLEGMVTFNVVLNEAGELFQAVNGPLVIEDQLPLWLKDKMNKAHFEFIATPNIRGYKWSKLLLNLNNSLNAISGVPLKEELEDRTYRMILSQLMDEALAVIKFKKINLVKLTPVSPYFVPTILRLPDFLFKMIAMKMIDIDPKAKSSMLIDLERNSETEIDSLNGKIVSHAKELGLKARANEKILMIIKEAQKRKSGSPRIPSDHLLKLINE